MVSAMFFITFGGIHCPEETFWVVFFSYLEYTLGVAQHQGYQELPSLWKGPTAKKHLSV